MEVGMITTVLPLILRKKLNELWSISPQGIPYQKNNA
jgi:hypothetical protein